MDETKRINNILINIITLCVIGLIIVFFVNSRPAKPDFTMRSNDTVGVDRHYVVGDKNEPTGIYTVTCTKGHGSLNINDEKLYVLAADGYVGKEYSGLTYTESITLKLTGNDVLNARNFNSSEFKLEFKLNK